MFSQISVQIFHEFLGSSPVFSAQFYKLGRFFVYLPESTKNVQYFRHYLNIYCDNTILQMNSSHVNIMLYGNNLVPWHILKYYCSTVLVETLFFKPLYIKCF